MHFLDLQIRVLFPNDVISAGLIVSLFSSDTWA